MITRKGDPRTPEQQVADDEVRKRHEPTHALRCNLCGNRFWYGCLPEETAESMPAQLTHATVYHPEELPDVDVEWLSKL
jgi:hypothetical protein